MIANKYFVIVGIIVLAACQGEGPSRNDRTAPDEFFREVFGDVPLDVRPFDCKATFDRTRKHSYWIAFDASSKWWHSIVAKEGLKEGPDFQLKYLSKTQFDEFGFEGYLDGDYVCFERSSTEGNFFVRPIKNFYRIVYFRRL